MSANDSFLLQIQRQQFRDRPAAESALKAHLEAIFGEGIRELRLNVRPESLNSFNGILQFASGERCFFKSHVEEEEQLSAYYRLDLLEEAGYPIASPKRIREQPGQQIALYEVLTYPTYFDLVKAAEDGDANIAWEAELHPAQRRFDARVQACFGATFAPSTEPAGERAAIHQLFSERLKPSGRLGLFYLGKSRSLGGVERSFESLARLPWVINGLRYRHTLAEIIAGAQALLEPDLPSATVLGHGDAHNGNLFWNAEAQELLLFDPAFAGRHSPLLDLVKPLFHNVFARWMYFPEQVDGEISLEMQWREDAIYVEHDFLPSKVRADILHSKLEEGLRPTLALLRERGGLEETWREFLRAALFCCPFLTVNLFAPAAGGGSLAERYTDKIRILGLALALEMGSLPLTGRHALRDLVDPIFET